MDIKGKDTPNKSAHPHAYSDAPYRMVIGETGRRWFYKPGKFAATAIYAESDEGNRGMAGSTIMFKLEDGTHHSSIGPWMGNALHMLEDTGIDLRAQYATRLIMSRNVEYPKNYSFMPDMIDVVHHEPEFVEGTFDRPNELAQSIADRMGERLFYFIETAGGAQTGQVSPREL